jgi:hypothetical protein
LFDLKRTFDLCQGQGRIVETLNATVDAEIERFPGDMRASLQRIVIRSCIRQRNRQGTRAGTGFDPG